MDPKDIRNLQEAYNSVYDDDLREEQEFKSWVTELLDEGYDLSDYTWNEMYDIYNEGYKDLGDKARDKGHQLLNKSKKTATRGNMYTGTLPSNTPEGENLKQRASQQFAVSAFHNPEKSQAKAAANKERGEGKKKAFGNRLTRSDKQGIKDSYDLYDIILSHLLDEGYADTIENAESIMVNMSEDWRQSIVEDEYMGDPRKIPTENGGSKPKDKLVVPPVPVLPPPTRPAPSLVVPPVPVLPPPTRPAPSGGGSIRSMPPPAPRGGGSIRSMPPKDSSAGSITLNRNKPGDDFIGPTVSTGGNTYGIPNPKFGRPQR